MEGNQQTIKSKQEKKQGHGQCKKKILNFLWFYSVFINVDDIFQAMVVRGVLEM